MPWRRPLICLCAAGLTACAALAPDAGDAARAAEILEQAGVAARQAPAEQRRLVAEARQAYEQSPDPAARLRLGAMLVLLAPPLRDDAGAQRVLEPLKGSQPPTLGANIAALLYSHAADRQRMEQQIERDARDHARQGQESARATQESTRAIQESTRAAQESTRALREQERAAKAAAERNEALLKQLEALKAADRRMLEREERAPKR